MKINLVGRYYTYTELLEDVVELVGYKATIKVEQEDGSLYMLMTGEFQHMGRNLFAINAGKTGLVTFDLALAYDKKQFEKRVTRLVKDIDDKHIYVDIELP